MASPNQVAVRAVEIMQVLLLHDDRTSEQLGAALWRVCEEVRRFFEPDPLEVGQGHLLQPAMWGVQPLSLSGPPMLIQTDFSRRYVAPQRPPELISTMQGEEFFRLTSAAEWPAQPDTYGRYDHRVLGEFVQQLVEPGGTVLVITDYELIPPEGWRYILWDVLPSGIILSTAPLEPSYWGERVSSPTHRAAAVKFRARAACLGIVGALLGLSRCDNPECYLLANVDTVSALDEMGHVGLEHGIFSLSGRGFAQPADPTRVEDARQREILTSA